jgi:UDP-2,3-diacylglucosamine pyrophosphatase LpxH
MEHVGLLSGNVDFTLTGKDGKALLKKRLLQVTKVYTEDGRRYLVLK